MRGFEGGKGEKSEGNEGAEGRCEALLNTLSVSFGVIIDIINGRNGWDQRPQTLYNSLVTRAK